MKSFFQEKARSEILKRLNRINPDSSAHWGTMNASQMICHLSDQLRMGLGDIATAPPAGPFRHWPINWIMISLVPWPKGKAQAPKEAFTNPPETWNEDINKLEKLAHRFGESDRKQEWPLHPLFGKMTGDMWGRLSYRHFDHHLRQFGE